MMAFLIDAQLPIALARWLAERNYRVQHVDDLGLLSASDSEIWTWAVDNKATIITKDDDFARRRVQSKTGPIIVWLRLGNIRNEALMAYFDKSLPVLSNEIEKGETLIELT